jgi:hypothetical protein
MLLAVWVDDVAHHPPSAALLKRSRELALAGQGEHDTLKDRLSGLRADVQSGMKMSW